MKSVDLKKALLYCKKGHEGQVRKYTNEPYHVHPIEVMEILRSIPKGDNITVTDDMLAAALFHDLVEDTSITLVDIEKEFNKHIAELVEMVTDISKPSDGKRAVRKHIDRLHLANASAEGQTIKLADLISNSKSIVKYDPNFAKVYLREKEDLLPYLVQGSSFLFKRAQLILEKSKGLL